MTPVESVLLLKLPSAKSAECEAKRRKVTVTVAKDGHEDHITATVPVGERGRVKSKTFSDMMFPMIDSTLAGVPRTCRDKRVVDHNCFRNFNVRHLWDNQLVGDEEPITKFSFAMKAWKTLPCSSHFQLCKTPSEKKSISLTESDKEADLKADFADATVCVRAVECAAKLLGEAALSEDAKAELNRIMVAIPTKKPLPVLPIVREVHQFVVSGECELSSMTMGDVFHVGLG